MYSSTFIFAAGPFDEAFHRLDEAIATAARALPGYLGEESWEDTRNGLVSNVYYWESLAALQALMQHPAHPRACLRSRRGSRWSAIARFRSNPSGSGFCGRSTALQCLRIAGLSTAHRALHPIP